MLPGCFSSLLDDGFFWYISLSVPLFCLSWEALARWRAAASAMSSSSPMLGAGDSLHPWSGRELTSPHGTDAPLAVCRPGCPSFPPSNTQPQALGSAPEGPTLPLAELLLPQTGRMWGNPVPPRARINFLTISHMLCGCPGLASAHLSRSYFSALGGRGRASPWGSDLRLVLLPSSQLESSSLHGEAGTWASYSW